MKTACTHDGIFHADDVYSSALLQNTFPGIRIKRSRSRQIQSEVDIVFDVGGVYNPKENRFDHHQEGFDVSRESGIPLSSLGLLWRKYGKDCIRSVLAPYKHEEFMKSIDNWCGYTINHIDTQLIETIDCIDNGYGGYVLSVRGGVGGNTILGNHEANTLSDFIKRMNKPQHEDNPTDNRKWFDKAVEIAVDDLKNMIINSYFFQKVRKEVVERALNASTSDNPQVLVLDRYISGVDTHLKAEELKNVDIHFVVFEQTEQWKIIGIPGTGGRFSQKTPLPSEWAGLEGESLAKASGYSDAVFAHRGRHFAIFGSKDSALKAVKAVLGNKRTTPREDLSNPVTQTFF